MPTYEIIATLGPASSSQAVWAAMLSGGASAFRLNTSHLSLEQLHAWLKQLDAFFAASGNQVPVTLDLQGSKWRLGRFTPFELQAGQPVELVLGATTDRPQVLPVPHTDFFRAAAVSSGEIVLSDAKIRLAIENGGPDWLSGRVLLGGEILPAKGITLADSPYRQEALSEKDRAILEQTAGLSFIRYAISYVKDAAEMARYRGLAGPGVYLVAKIERQPALAEAEQVAAWANELWLCRGDLGAELGLPAMAAAVHGFAALPGQLAIPVIMAGQVLEHMTAHPTPTRSEVCYLYDALCQGYAGVVLSDETAAGRYPVESCRAAALFKQAAAHETLSGGGLA